MACKEEIFEKAKQLLRDATRISVQLDDSEYGLSDLQFDLQLLINGCDPIEESYKIKNYKDLIAEIEKCDE